MDGFHVPVVVPIKIQAEFWDRKNQTSTNNLVVVNFDRRITYLLVGWEGSCHDARLLSNARDRGFIIPHGKFVLADAGFRNEKDVLTPYRGVRYHLQEFAMGRAGPQNAQELFNLRHSQMRVIVECTIGIMKERWHIINDIPSYAPELQAQITRAAGILHNFAQVSSFLLLAQASLHPSLHLFLPPCLKVNFHCLLVVSLTREQVDALVPDPFNSSIEGEIAWSPLQFPNANAFRDALAADMWQKYIAAGEFVEVVTPFQRAQRVGTIGTNAENPIAL